MWWGRRLVALMVSAVTVLGTLVVSLTAFAPAAAGAAGLSGTAYVANFYSNTVTPTPSRFAVPCGAP
jgi:hypothetical protein